MKTVRYERLGGPEVMELVDLPRPSPAPGEVVVAVEAAGVNFSDLGRRRGLYLDATPLPFVPGSEIVGRVTALGTGVSSVTLGDRVAGVLETRSGGYAEFCTISASLVARIDDQLDASLAVAVPNQGATALHALESLARLKPGESIAVTAAAVCTDTTNAWRDDRLGEATNGRGCDVVLDRIGGNLASAPSASLARLYAMVASGSLTPIVGLEFPLEKAVEAHAAMETRTTIGKIVLTVDNKRTTMKKESR